MVSLHRSYMVTVYGLLYLERFRVQGLGSALTSSWCMDLGFHLFTGPPLSPKPQTPNFNYPSLLREFVRPPHEDLSALKS